MKDCIEIKSQEDIIKHLNKNQIKYFIDKAKKAMDTYDLLIEMREKCSDPFLVEEVFGEHIFIIYRSIFGKNNLSNNKTVKIDYQMFLVRPPKVKFFKMRKSDYDDYKHFHELVISLVDKVYAHTDLNSEYKKISEVSLERRKITSSIEHGVDFNGITIAVNIISTVYYSLSYIKEKNNYCLCHAEYVDGSWVSLFFEK